MTGYLETLTDRSYWGQMVVQTFPLIGNYGVIPADFESDAIGPSAYIVKHWCQAPSNFRSEGSLDTFFKERGVIGLSGVDTRTLTKIIREAGVMNGVITDDPAAVDFEALKAYRVTGAVKASSTKERYVVSTTTAQEIAAMGVDGIMLSNGPGDPAENVEIIANLREICKLGIPLFGICLGHQLLALAHGFQTEKLKYGHRGANQPVKNLETGRVYISSQNHGYAVVSGSIDSKTAKELFVNVNDGTCEGIRYLDCPAFSVQFHPEACGGPLDTQELFDQFFAMMKEGE